MSLVHRLEVLMISSPNRDDLVFPKGGWEDDETVDEAACREALEEAGVNGIIHLSVTEAKNLRQYPWMREALENCVKHLNQAAFRSSETSCYGKPSEPKSLDSAIDARVATPLEAFC